MNKRLEAGSSTEGPQGRSEIWHTTPLSNGSERRFQYSPDNGRVEAIVHIDHHKGNPENPKVIIDRLIEGEGWERQVFPPQ